MNPTYLNVSNEKLLLSFILIFINYFLSSYFKLKLEKQFLWASFRTIFQLIILGYVLVFIFEQNNPYLIFFVMLIMSLNAGLTSAKRIKYRYKKMVLDNILSNILSVWPLTVFALFIINPTPWYLPQYTLPLIGMIFGNSINGISLGIDRFISDFYQKKEILISELALGGTNKEVMTSIIQDALRTAMTPTINSMIAMGIVSIPGMMTGQLIVGANPTHASKYQIILMLLISTSTFIGALIGIKLASHKFINHNHQLVYDNKY